MNKSKRDMIEVQHFRQKQNKEKKGTFQYDCNREVEKKGAAKFSRQRNPPRRSFVYPATFRNDQSSQDVVIHLSYLTIGKKQLRLRGFPHISLFSLEWGLGSFLRLE